MKARIVESGKAQKDLNRTPSEVLRAYEIWARLIEEHGAGVLTVFKGYRDEKLRGEWIGYRSSRLNRKWRVIYTSNRQGQIEVVRVERVVPHEYRRKR